MDKEHPCGDDFEFANPTFARTYSSPANASIPMNFFSPAYETWYTIWSHVRMNTAGAHRWLCRRCESASQYVCAILIQSDICH